MQSHEKVRLDFSMESIVVPHTHMFNERCAKKVAETILLKHLFLVTAEVLQR